MATTQYGSLTLLALVLLLSSCTEAAHLGCFWMKKVKLVSAGGGPSNDLPWCRTACAKKKMPIYALDCTSKCMCSAEIPDRNVKTKTSSCKATKKTGSCPTINLHYISHKDTQNKGCRLAPLSPGAFNYPEGRDRVTVSGPTITMTMRGPGTGGRAESKDANAYGMYSVRMRAGTGKSVTAFYLTSNLIIPPANNWDEIDYETINTRNNTDIPGMIWTNFFVEGQSVEAMETRPDVIGNIVGNQKFRIFNDVATYTIDWQPTHIRWYLNGKLLKERVGGKIPTKAQWLVLSLWGRDGDGCWWWGGCTPAGETATASFSNTRRILC